MHAELELTEKQAAYLVKLDHRYRRQTGGAHICTDLCATYGRRKTGECFDAPLPPKPEKALNFSHHAALPLFDGEASGSRSGTD